MSSRSRMIGLAATAVLGASVVTIGSAGAQAPATAKLEMVGGISVKPGKFIKDDQRFAPRNLAVRSGGQVRLANKTKTPDPHTISLVRRRDVPKTPAETFECEACGPFFEAHQVNEETGDVAVPVVDVGEEGFDRPGDSIFVAPDEVVRFDVSAEAGTRLYYLCAVHPWMQGKLRVR